MDSLPSDEPPEDPATLAAKISPDSFDSWYAIQQTEANIRDGKPYFNSPAPVPETGRVSASQLLTCHRQLYYKQQNAPRESRRPRGIFWAGSAMEEDVIVPYLDSLTDEGQFIQNSLWVTTTVDTANGEVEIKGETDPAFVRAEGEPVLVTEIKTTTSLDTVDEPRDHHRAQLHAYLHGLSSEWSKPIDGVILYVDRSSLDIKSFFVEFDEEYWDTVVQNWGEEFLKYRMADRLPPANPQFDWECQYCDYRNRCGQTDKPFQDELPEGFLPQFEYPKSAVTEYLQSHDDVKLTPTLANQYPALAQSYAVNDWVCDRCGEHYAWGSVDWNRPSLEPPSCPTCSSDLHVPIPVTPPSLSER